MNNLNEKTQERLDRWRKNKLPVISSEKIKGAAQSRRNGKNDYGDVLSIEEWEEEVKRSQNRR